MFCVLYEMKVKADQVQPFREAWHSLTQTLVKTNGSLCARLHKKHDGSAFIAYAQWPDQLTWEAGHEFIDKELHRLHLDQCFDEIPSIVMKLDVVDDLLV
jgi:quinol monooxygenase YgiN